MANLFIHQTFSPTTFNLAIRYALALPNIPAYMVAPYVHIYCIEQ